MVTMSIHVTVSSNPVSTSRSKVLLTDHDFAKKSEWNRRRKLRLQQVRQQSSDLASNLRKKCDAENKFHYKQECDENEQELKQWQVKQLQKLQKEYDDCIVALGTGHRTAVCQVEDERFVKEKQDLKDALAKARGALARERAKISAKTLSSKKEKMRSFNPVLEEVDNNIRNKLTKIPLSSRSKSKSPVKSYINKTITATKGDGNRKVKINVKYPTECTIHSPVLPGQHKWKQRKMLPRVRKLTMHQDSPSRDMEVKETSVCVSEDCDDSYVTWPPRSSCDTKANISPQKVKFYNHDERICKEYMKPTRNVTHIEARSNDEMERYIEEEEDEIVKRAEFDVANKQKNVSRGQKALNKERLQREFKLMTRQFSEVDKQQRIARIFEFPYPFSENKEVLNDKEKVHFDAIPSSTRDPTKQFFNEGSRFPNGKSKTEKELKAENFDQELKKCFELGALSDSVKSHKKDDYFNQSHIKSNPFTLKNLIKDLEKERDLLLNSTLQKSPLKEVEHTETECKDIQDVLNESLNKVNNEKPTMKNVEETREAQIIESDQSKKRNIENVKRPHPIEVKVITKPICDCCDVCTCQNQSRKSDQDFEKISHYKENNKKDQPTDLGIAKKCSLDKIKQGITAHSGIKHRKRCSIEIEKDDSSSESKDESIKSNDEIKITVKLTEKNSTEDKLEGNEHINEKQVTTEDTEKESQWCGRLNDNKDIINSSSSYYSPPSKLSAAELDILNSVLLKLCLKNNNPQLHKYIKRLLSMSKGSIDNLAVSSPSEISVQSDLFPSLKRDRITGTYYLQDRNKKVNKKLTINDCKSQSEIFTGRTNCKILKKVVQLNSSSEDSTSVERIPFTKEAVEIVDSPKFSHLADEYTIRLQELIEMLNQVSPIGRSSERRCNESSSYIFPFQLRSPLSERLESSSNIEDELSGCREIWTALGNSRKKNDVFSSDQENCYVRNNITNLGLPFELLPKPFTLCEEAVSKELESKNKPPIASNNRIIGILPKELSTIPEVSSKCIEKELYSRTVLQECGEHPVNELCLSDDDVLDVSSIKESTPKKDKHTKDNLYVKSQLHGCLVSDTSSLSILSHMSNESLIDVGSDVSDKDINSFLESPAENIEEVFRSLGVGWALSTLRKTRQSRQRDSTSTTSTSNENSTHIVDRVRSKSAGKIKGNVCYSHSTPKKSVERHYSSSAEVTEEIYRKFNALKSDRLSLTPPDLALNVPNLGCLRNNYNINSDSSGSEHFRL